MIDPNCFMDVTDLGAIDVQRGRDHGIPLYNDLRRAYGLRPVRSFTDITGESTDQLPPGLTINSPSILDFTKLLDDQGNVIPLGSDNAQEDAVVGVRRSTLASRLKAIYGDVNKVDAFVGMVSEKHVPGTEFGPLQLAMWTKQFAALRDGDRFFYANDPVLDQIQRAVRRHVQGHAVAADQARHRRAAPAGRVPARRQPADGARPAAARPAPDASAEGVRQAVTKATIQRRGEVSEWSKERDWKSRRC